jgi:hypothetical protein
VVDSDAATLLASFGQFDSKGSHYSVFQLPAQHLSWSLDNIYYPKLFHHGLFQLSVFSVDPEQKTIPNGTAINSNHGNPSPTAINTSRPSAARSTAVSATCKYTRFNHEIHN